MDDLDGKIETTAPPMSGGALEIINHFKGVEKSVEAELAPLVEDLPNPLDFKELSEQLCAEIHEAMQKAELWNERLKSLKDQAKRLAGLSRGAMPFGGYILEVKESKGRTTVKWEKYVKDQMTQAAVDEAKARYSEEGDPVISCSVKKLGAKQ